MHAKNIYLWAYPWGWAPLPCCCQCAFAFLKASLSPSAAPRLLSPLQSLLATNISWSCLANLPTAGFGLSNMHPEWFMGPALLFRKNASLWWGNTYYRAHFLKKSTSGSALLYLGVFGLKVSLQCLSWWGESILLNGTLSKWEGAFLSKVWSLPYILYLNEQ